MSSVSLNQGAILPAPAQIYHRTNRTLDINEAKPGARGYNIRMNIDLKNIRDNPLMLAKFSGKS